VLILKRIKINLSINPNKKYYYLFRTNSPSIFRSLYKNEKKLELLVQKEKADDWTDAFKEIGVYQDVRGSTLSLVSRNDEVGKFYNCKRTS
jgi:hypothetical protein